MAISGTERLDFKYKVEYEDQDRVLVTIDGNLENIYKGKIVGCSSKHIIDCWIVELDNYDIPNYKFKVINIAHPNICYDRPGNTFLCDFSKDPVNLKEN